MIYIYNPIIKKFNENNRSLNNVTCEKAVIFSNTDNAYYYEAVYFQVDENKYSYPFTSIKHFNKDMMLFLILILNVHYLNIIQKTRESE